MILPATQNPEVEYLQVQGVKQNQILIIYQLFYFAALKYSLSANSAFGNPVEPKIFKTDKTKKPPHRLIRPFYLSIHQDCDAIPQKLGLLTVIWPRDFLSDRHIEGG